MESRDDLRAVAVAAVEAAGRVIRASPSGGPAPAATVKGAGDFVTDVDRAAEEAALAVLRGRTPGIPVLAEESGGVEAERLWVVDPLDGTTNFIRRFPLVGVSAALMEDGRPVVGAIAAPLLGELWSGARGLGARDARGEPLAVTPSDGLGVVATGFPFRTPRNLVRYVPVMNAALERFEDLRRPGAASLDLAHSAAGVWEGFFELGLAVWDIAAGALLVLEAGGVVTDWGGDPLDVYRSGDILAGAPAWHEQMLDVIRSVEAGRAA